MPSLRGRKTEVGERRHGRSGREQKERGGKDRRANYESIRMGQTAIYFVNIT